MELANRDKWEAKIGRKLASLSARRRRELVSLLGSPPDADNVPESFWQAVQEEHERELALLLYLLFIASARQHGASDGDELATAGQRWADRRATEVARGYVATSKDRLANRGKEWKAKIDGGIDIPAADVVDGATGIFGPSRVENETVSETTTGASAGAEWAVDATVGKSDDDTWYTVNDRKVCPVCQPLHGTKRSKWERFFPSGPPAHGSCRCWIEYAAEKTGQPAGAT